MAASAAGQSDRKAEVCLACHGANGSSSTPLTPSLGGQPAFYVLGQMVLFREGRRTDAIMSEQAKGLTDEELRRLAALIEKLPPPRAPTVEVDRTRYRRGRALAAERHCIGCHGEDFAGGRNVPRVANQREDYTLKALKDYRSGARIGFGNAVMPESVAGASDAELADIAYFLAYLNVQ